MLDAGGPTGRRVYFLRDHRSLSTTIACDHVIPGGVGQVIPKLSEGFRIKQYLKDGRVMRVEGVTYAPATWGATPACPVQATCRTGPPPTSADWKAGVLAKAPSDLQAATA
jgi:hypothetical protein